ncbi:MAG TPA: YicC/YloC family endoribonuclease [Candidatus Manganitrophaceae bacterium]|nr:YicC/YloC family endoribonuclease [Candidatus Manganitrophaceae bacterium]
MIRSMTGYGRAEGHYKSRSLVVELRSVNHRYCDVAVRLPKSLSSLEEGIKKKIQSQFARGHIDLSVSFNGTSGAEKRLKLDLESAEAYYHTLKKLKGALRLSGEIDLAMMARFMDLMILFEPVEEEMDKLSRRLDQLISRATQALQKMRQEEGKALAKDLSGRLAALSKMLGLIQVRRKEVGAAYYQKLQARVAELSKGIPVDPGRLAQEVAIFAERSDISEEILRLKTHLEQFQKMTQKDEAVGRTLDFLLQEMNREVNTIGSKANDAAISLQVVAMKSELEKVREQVQNIE